MAAWRRAIELSLGNTDTVRLRSIAQSRTEPASRVKRARISPGHGTVSLLAGIDLVIGKVHALVKDRHLSCEFTEFLALLDAAYPARTAIKLILDNHSAYISK
jgi:hypothetical protein